MKLIDLTHPYTLNHFRSIYELHPRHTHEKNVAMSQLIYINGHSHTHVDAPLHYLPDGDSMEKVSLEKFYGEASIVNLAHVNQNEPITIEALEEKGKHIRPGDIILLRTDWPLKCDYKSRDFWLEAPYLKRDSLKWLVEQRPKMIGIDFPPEYSSRLRITDPTFKPTREDMPFHDTLFPPGIMVVEYLCNLHLLHKERTLFMALPIPFEGGDGSPTRAVALEI